MIDEFHRKLAIPVGLDILTITAIDKTRGKETRSEFIRGAIKMRLEGV